MSGGGGTTYQTTTLPSGVENTLNASAQTIGGLINSANKIDQYLGANPQGTAGWNVWELAGVNNLGLGTQRTGAENALLNYIGAAPGYAGTTPGTFYSATGQRPQASQESLNWMGSLLPTAGEVSGRFYQGSTPQEQQAWINALNANIVAGSVPDWYANSYTYARGAPEYFSALAASQEARGQGLLPTGGNLATSPSLAAAQQAFQTAIRPTIENQAAVSGLGRSTALTNATAQAEAQYMLPIIQDELNREFQANQMRYQTMGDVGLQQALAAERGAERTMQVGLEQAQAVQNMPQTFLASAQMLSQLGQQDTARALQAAEAEERGTVRRMQAIDTAIATLQSQGQQDLARQLELATAEERAISRGSQAMMAGYDPLLQQAGQETARLQEYYNRIGSYGALQRQMEQAQLDAQYNDFLRRQAMSEQALYGAWGSVPSAFGQIVRQTGGGGLFK